MTQSKHSVFLRIAQLAQCGHEDVKKHKVMEQGHKPLMCSSGKYNSPQLRWHISQKELFPMQHIMQRLDYLVYGHPSPVHIFTDHRNLAYILKPNWKKNNGHVEWLSRWSLRFQLARMIMYHIPGTDNRFADIISRWGNPEFETLGKIATLEAMARKLSWNQYFQFYEVKAAELIRITRQEMEAMEPDDNRLSFLSPNYESKWERVSEEKILKAQKEQGIGEGETLKRDRRGRIIIP
eukprot:maker-scaffold_3-snap-gene-10.54-mRNA-1 protein AED:0.79 eAED:0.84 QI:0/0/0/1/0/0/2/0/236